MEVFGGFWRFSSDGGLVAVGGSKRGLVGQGSPLGFQGLLLRWVLFDTSYPWETRGNVYFQFSQVKVTPGIPGVTFTGNDQLAPWARYMPKASRDLGNLEKQGTILV